MENVADIYTLSSTQEGILFHSLRDSRNGIYINLYSCRICGDPDAGKWRQVWQSLLEDHPILRTAILWDGLEEPLQVVREVVKLPWTVLDWSALSAEEQQQRLTELLAEERRQGFELAAAPLMRLTMARLSEKEFQFIWTSHHIILDGWSSQSLLQQARERYNQPESDAATPPPFRNYIKWLQERDNDAAEQFWKNMLGDFSKPSILSRQSASGPDDDYGQIIETIDAALAERLQAMARKNRVTLNTLFSAAWALVLERFCDSDDVLFGTTVSGRPAGLPGAEKMIGMFINTLPLRVDCRADQPIGDWVSDILQRQTDMRDFEYSSLAEIPGWSAIPAGQKLFDSIVVFENYPQEPAGDANQLQIAGEQYHERSNFPLAVIVFPGEPFQLYLVNDHQFISDEFARQLLAEYLRVLSALADADPQDQLASLLMTATSEPSILDGPAFDAPQDACLHHLIEKQAVDVPAQAAVVYGDTTLSYAELDERANRLAALLQQKGLNADQPVGVFLPRSAEMPVALLAVLKSGRAYVPIDPAYPAGRIQAIIGDSGIGHLLTTRAAQKALPTEIDGEIIFLDDPATLSGFAASDFQAPDLSPDQLAYLIYTSGSTGKPRGVMVPHRAIVYSTVARFQYYPRQPQRFLLLSSFAFDSSMVGIFWTLCSGGTLVIPQEEHYRDGDYLAGLLASRKITHLLSVPSLYQLLLQRCGEQAATLQTAVVAGEACPAELISMHRETLPECGLYNEYGPTEATVWCSVYNCRDYAGSDAVPIGSAIPGSRLSVLDRHRREVPRGVSGELYISGPGCAEGYHGNPELTAERFVELPGADGQRAYRSGDRVRLQADGNLAFLGRLDNQLKIRGYRVEPAEIEQAIESHPDVSEAVVVALRSDRSAVTPAVLAEALLKLPQDQISALLAADDDDAASEKVVRDPRFEVRLRLDDNYVDPPRQSQREWLINQLLAEFSDDLRHLDRVAKDFVPGKSSDLAGYDIAESNLNEQQIMEDWQTPVMRAMAEQVTATHGDILEIGFGRGVSAAILQEYGLRSHTIVESNSHSVERFFKPWRAGLPDRDIRMIHARWQDAREQLQQYDGVFFHAFPLNEAEFIEYILNSITFAEHFFADAAALLKKGGAFTYLTTEIDSFSRRHQRALFEHFSSIQLSVLPVDVPEDTEDTWWAKTMVIVKAIK